MIFIIILSKWLVIDAQRIGNESRFLNHCCEPNCKIEKWKVNGLPRIAVFANRNIQSGEELTFDYNFCPFSRHSIQECKCGSEKCRSVIGPKGRNAKNKVCSLQNKDTSRHGGIVENWGYFMGHSKHDVQRFNKYDASKRKHHYQLPDSKEELYILKSRCFLLRNLKWARKLVLSFIRIYFLFIKRFIYINNRR